MNSKHILLRVENLVKYFPITKGIIFQKETGSVHAVDDISFQIHLGETLGLVGESGSGKTTTGLVILQLDKPTSGKVYFENQNLMEIKSKELREFRCKMQMIFQDPYASLNPRMTVRELVSEPLIIHKMTNGKELEDQVSHLLHLVGLSPRLSNRYPHEFSGGQRQRIGIARALALQPSLIVCDEPISALDVSIQAQIVNLLEDLQRDFNLTYLFIAHDLAMVRHISDRVAVMYLGVIMEIAIKGDLYNNPLHPYTQALISAVPIPDPVAELDRKRIILKGDIPSPINPPSGCRFRTRCPIAEKICQEVRPEFRQVNSDHYVACHLV